MNGRTAHQSPLSFYLCKDIGCSGTGSDQVYDEFQRQRRARTTKQESPFAVYRTGCKGLCSKGPVLEVLPEGTYYFNVKAEDVGPIIDSALNGKLYQKRLYSDPNKKTQLSAAEEIPFYAGQKKLVLAAMGRVRPESLEDYQALGGFQALGKALKMQAKDVVSVIENSGLRGRGGGGFSTGKKWRSVFEQDEPIRYLICNGDEGDPGAFMDRSLMQGAPYQILEGMIIAAYAVGAHEGFIYVRDEYPLAIENLTRALSVLESEGLLGRDILSSGFDLNISIKRGAGAFVCGESSALMRSIEGKLGEPNEKYIHASERGLWGKPTVVNNVETFANIPFILNNGADSFRSTGTKKNPGTKVFCLVGKVKNAGLVEVELGTTIADVVEKIGGGMHADRSFKAVQTGGPSGGCIPASLAETPVDFDSLDKLGSMMGSGGLIIMDEFDCMVELARYFTNFLVQESCGKCTPCREGLIQILRILERITEGRGRMKDLDTLAELGDYVTDGSLCGLGKSAANPLLSTLRYFRDEYIDHIRNAHCSAGVCKPLTAFTIDPEACTKCRLCIKACPVDAISEKTPGGRIVIDQELCIRCGECRNVCLFNAVKW